MEMQDFDVAMAPAYMISDIYFIFRSNGEEVEINLKTNLITHQLSFREINFVNDFYPFIKIENYKIKKKTY